MKDLRLEIRRDAYELLLDGEPLATLIGGAAALLRGSGERLREADVEVLIERSEDWLMPSSKAFQQLELRVRDTAGRLRSLLEARGTLTPAETEQAFNRAFDAVAHQRAVDREGLADVVLLRELVHHGSLARIVFE